MKTLYLDRTEPYAVVLDGPALRVQQMGSADRWYPLNRLTRVVDMGSSQWETEAMLACLDAGITLTFLHRGGRLRGQCFGARARELELGERLEDLLTQPEWESAYQIWREAAEQMVILGLLARLPRGEINLRAKSLRRATLALALQYARKPFVFKIDQLLAGLVSAQVAEQVDRLGLARHLSFFEHKGLRLIFDVTHIVLWEAELEKLRFLQHHYHRSGVLTAGMLPQLRYSLIKAYESHSPQMESQIRYVFDNLHHWLVERA